MLQVLSLTTVLLHVAQAGIMSYGQYTGAIGDPNQQAQASTFNGIHYSQQGPAFNNLQQQALSYSNQANPAFGPPGVYNGHYATPQSFPQTDPSYTNPIPQQQQVYNNHLSIPQQQQPQQPLAYNNQLSIPQQHQQQINSAFPNTQQESPALASARAAAALRSNAAAASAGKAGASQLGVNFSSASEVSQLRYSGPGINFSY